MFVFGSETTIRSLQGNHLPYQRRRNLLFCFVAILVAVLLTWVPSYTSLSKGICPATLIWWTTNYANIGLAIGSWLLFTNIVCAAVIRSQSMRTVDIDHNQRIAASRVVYYLIVSASLMVSTTCSFLEDSGGFSTWPFPGGLNFFVMVLDGGCLRLVDPQLYWCRHGHLEYSANDRTDSHSSFLCPKDPSTGCTSDSLGRRGISQLVWAHHFRPPHVPSIKRRHNGHSTTGRYSTRQKTTEALWSWRPGNDNAQHVACALEKGGRSIHR